MNLKSIAGKTFSTFRVNTPLLSHQQFMTLPSWTIVNNKEIKISSSEIRKQRELLRK